MRLVNTYFDLELKLVENQVIVLSIENSTAYSRVLMDIWNQINGFEGSFILSEDEKIKKVSKEIECIFNLFALDCNNKRVLTRLYQELKEQSITMLQEETTEVNAAIIEYLEKLIMTVPYSIKYNIETDVSAIMKMYGVEIDNQAESLLEMIIEYIKVVSQICMVKIFVFVDLKHYLNTMELEELYEFVYYQKVNLIIIEPVHTEKILNEKCWIIDKDLCIIDL